MKVQYSVRLPVEMSATIEELRRKTGSISEAIEELISDAIAARKAPKPDAIEDGIDGWKLVHLWLPTRIALAINTLAREASCTPQTLLWLIFKQGWLLSVEEETQ